MYQIYVNDFSRSPFSIAACANTILKLDVRSTKVLIAPAVTLVNEASSKPGVPFNLKRIKQAINPPKIKISDGLDKVIKWIKDNETNIKKILKI